MIMTLEDKLELFYETVVEDAITQSKELIEEYESSLEEEYEERRAAVERDVTNAYLSEKEELFHERNKKLSQAIKEVKKQTMEKEKEYIDALFLMIEEKVRAYMKTDEYEKSLEEQILHAKELADGEDVYVYINASDEAKQQSLEAKTGVSVLISTTEFIGGVRAVIRSNNILIDNSFLSKIAEEKEAYKM